MHSLTKADDNKMITKKSPRNDAFTTSKDFVFDKSLGSIDFESSFGEVHKSFYSSSENTEKILENLEVQRPQVSPNQAKVKEEETDYTLKPVLVLDNEDIKRCQCCNNCIFKGSSEGNCLVI